mgnify:CR=1 FL=1
MAKSELQKQIERTNYINNMLAKGYVFVPITELETYKPIVNQSIINKILNAILKGEKSVPILRKQYVELPIKLQKYKDDTYRLNKCAELNNIGIQYEKNNDIAGAIKVYEQNIEIKYPATHSYKRLMILYRKQGDLENELRVIKIACKVFPKSDEYKNRREKVQELIKKAKQKPNYKS